MTFEPPDYPSSQEETDPERQKDAQANKGIAAAAYLLFFLPLIAARQSRFALFHANQGLVLLLTAIAANVVFGLIPLLGQLLVPLANLALLVLAIIGILNAISGFWKPLPFIGRLTIIKPL